jgi:hypothetical protein
VILVISTNVSEAPRFPVVLDVDAGEIDRRLDLLGRLDRIELHAVRVRRAFSRDLVDDVVKRLETDGFGIRSAAAPPEGEPVQLFGLPVQWAETNLEKYLATADLFREACRALFDGFDYEARIATLLDAVTAPRPVEVMRGLDGGAYTPSTIRRIAPGGSIPPHAENHQLAFPGSHEVARAIERGAVMSFFTLLSAPESGGELVLHALDVDRFERDRSLAANQTALGAELARHPAGAIAVDPGDTLLLNSGRFFHEVTPVGGGRPRWTIGGFFAKKSGGGSVVYWG